MQVQIETPRRLISHADERIEEVKDELHGVAEQKIQDLKEIKPVVRWEEQVFKAPTVTKCRLDLLQRQQRTKRSGLNFVPHVI